MSPHYGGGSRPEAALWREFCDVDTTCTYFQTPSWVDVLTLLDPGWRNASVLLRFRQGVEVLVPRVSRRVALGAFRSNESVPPGVYGAPLVRGGALEASHLSAVADLFRGARAAAGALTEVPGHPLDLGTRREIRTTQFLRLTPADSEEALLSRYRKGHRADVLGARREGVVVTLARERNDIEAYDGVYQDTVKRWRRMPYMVYPAAVFHALFARAVSGEHVRIWLARRNGELLGGVIVLLHGRHAAYWHAASTEAGRALHAGHLALHTAIADAVTLGAEIFDFMPSAGLAAVEAFKAGFAGEPESVGVHRFPGSRTYRALRWAKALADRSA